LARSTCLHGELTREKVHYRAIVWKPFKGEIVRHTRLIIPVPILTMIAG
jgi:hypothetical protein